MLPGARSVVAFFLPFERGVVKSNRGGRVPSPEWALAYRETNTLINRILQGLPPTLLENFGVRASAAPATWNFDPVTLSCTWSHKKRVRHRRPGQLRAASPADHRCRRGRPLRQPGRGCGVGANATRRQRTLRLLRDRQMQLLRRRLPGRGNPPERSGRIEPGQASLLGSHPDGERGRLLRQVRHRPVRVWQQRAPAALSASRRLST